MKIFNQQKTQELNQNDIDLTIGHLEKGRLFIRHHSGSSEVEAKSVEQIVSELVSKGKKIISMSNGKNYLVAKEYPNGQKDLNLITAEPSSPAEDGYDEYEEILVYIPYTVQELHEMDLNALRKRRELECFPVVNRGQLWYETLTDEQRQQLKTWYQQWLDVTETLVPPEKPIWLK